MKTQKYYFSSSSLTVSLFYANFNCRKKPLHFKTKSVVWPMACRPYPDRTCNVTGRETKSYCWALWETRIISRLVLIWLQHGVVMMLRWTCHTLNSKPRKVMLRDFNALPDSTRVAGHYWIQTQGISWCYKQQSVQLRLRKYTRFLKF